MTKCFVSNKSPRRHGDVTGFVHSLNHAWAMKLARQMQGFPKFVSYNLSLLPTFA